MKIKDGWQFGDGVSGLDFRLRDEKALDVLTINGRDFYFTKDGEFDGTGSGVCVKQKPVMVRAPEAVVESLKEG